MNEVEYLMSCTHGICVVHGFACTYYVCMRVLGGVQSQRDRERERERERERSLIDKRVRLVFCWLKHNRLVCCITRYLAYVIH